MNLNEQLSTSPPSCSDPTDFCKTKRLKLGEIVLFTQKPGYERLRDRNGPFESSRLQRSPAVRTISHFNTPQLWFEERSIHLWEFLASPEAAGWVERWKHKGSKLCCCVHTARQTGKHMLHLNPRQTEAILFHATMINVFRLFLLKEQFTEKWKFCHYLLMSYILPSCRSKTLCLKNLHATVFYKITVHSDQETPQKHDLCTILQQKANKFDKEEWIWMSVWKLSYILRLFIA